MGVENLLKEKRIQLEDLEEGKMYLGELIVRRSEKTNLMTTARRDGKEIWITYHRILLHGKRIDNISIDGGQEYSREDKEYDELNKKLREAGK